MGFPDLCIALPAELTDNEEALGELCRQHTARLVAWIDARTAETLVDVDAPRTLTRFDGSVRAACRIYQEDPRSPFHDAKENTQGFYVDSLKILENEVGGRQIRNLTVFDVRGWYKTFRAPVIYVDDDGVETFGPERVKRAHDAIAMWRMVLWFNAKLRHPHCKLLAEELAKEKYEKGGAREQELTYQQAVAFIRTALEQGQRGVIPLDRARYLAIGVAAQFELTLRQKDIIGEWRKRKANMKIPAGQQQLELPDEIWAGYFTWESIPGWRWRLKTSKSKYRAAAEFDLTLYPLLFPLLEAVPHDQRTGAIVKGEHGLPLRERSYRKWFRPIARAAGIPDDIWIMDSRAGGATEAEDAGADRAAIQVLLTHTRPETTERYIRRTARKIADVQQARNAKRTADEGGAP